MKKSTAKFLLVILVAVSLFSMIYTAIAQIAYGQGYQIDEKAASETIDRLKTDGISLFQLLARMTHTAVGGSVDTFSPEEIDPRLVAGLSLIATVIIVVLVALAWSGKITKMIMIVMLSVVILFMGLPLFQVPTGS